MENTLPLDGDGEAAPDVVDLAALFRERARRARLCRRLQRVLASPQCAGLAAAFYGTAIPRAAASVRPEASVALFAPRSVAPLTDPATD